MSTLAADLLVQVLGAESERVLTDIATGLAGVIGAGVEITPLPPDPERFAAVVGDRPAFRCRVEREQHEPLPLVLALDLASATRTSEQPAGAGAGPAASASGEVAPELHGALAKISDAVCAVLRRIVDERHGRTLELQRSGTFTTISPQDWPALLSEIPRDEGWTRIAGVISVAGEAQGALLIAVKSATLAAVDAPEIASAQPTGAGDEPALAPVVVQVSGYAADGLTSRLHQLFHGLGARVLPLSTSIGHDRPDVVLIVSRTPADVLARLAALERSGHKPATTIVCTEHPTREFVVAAKRGGAEECVVLPAERERLKALVGRVLARA